MNHNNIVSNRKTDLPVFSGLDKRPSENGDKWIEGYILQVRLIPLQNSFPSNSRNPNTGFRLFLFQISTDSTQIPPLNPSWIPDN
ncbi:hypothetical protein, partial [Neisseria flavescens]|uniref:hypothetical protein n=1 Tax=Neisseria flavescens TaxID=484 RepID=UPI001E433AB8